jgi:hypothetical protein
MCMINKNSNPTLYSQINIPIYKNNVLNINYFSLCNKSSIFYLIKIEYISTYKII